MQEPSTLRNWRLLTDTQIQKDHPRLVEPMGLTGDYRIDVRVETSPDDPDDQTVFMFRPSNRISMRPEMSMWDATKIFMKWFEAFPVMDAFILDRYSVSESPGWLDIDMNAPGWNPTMEEYWTIVGKTDESYAHWNG